MRNNQQTKAMSKKWKIFFKFLYLFFVLTIGLFLILVYPSSKKDELSFVYLNNYIENKEFDKAVDLLSYVYNKNSIQNEKVTDESGIVIFEGLSLFEQTLENDKKTVVMNEAYICIIYDLDKLQFYGNENKTALKVNDGIIEILSHDRDGDGVVDSVPSLVNSNYITFTIDKCAFDEVETIELVDKDGNIYFKKINMNLNFTSEFFTATKNFIEEYNKAYKDDKFSEEENTLLYSEYEKIHKANSDYQMIDHYSTSEKVFKDATKETILFMLTYFIWVYILGDCLVGKRYIFSFIKFLFRKIKDKIKTEKEEPEIEVGNNFYSLVTFEATVCEGFEKDIIISYESLTDKQNNFKVIINKKDDYLLKQRVRSGKYQLFKVECADYEVQELPSEIEIKGYTMLIKFYIQNKK